MQTKFRRSNNSWCQSRYSWSKFSCSIQVSNFIILRKPLSQTLFNINIYIKLKFFYFFRAANESGGGRISSQLGSNSRNDPPNDIWNWLDLLKLNIFILRWRKPNFSLFHMHFYFSCVWKKKFLKLNNFFMYTLKFLICTRTSVFKLKFWQRTIERFP